MPPTFSIYPEQAPYTGPGRTSDIMTADQLEDDLRAFDKALPTDAKRAECSLYRFGHFMTFLAAHHAIDPMSDALAERFFDFFLVELVRGRHRSHCDCVC